MQLCCHNYTRVLFTYMYLYTQVSDDEDDTHPNIDTASLFRWRHQARVERMEKAKEEKEQFKATNML